ncbi:MAG: SpoIID/LytB domain-containing protein [Myxococcales bacterium]
MSRLGSCHALVAVTLLAACNPLEGGTPKGSGEASTLQVPLRVRDSETGLPVARASVSARALSTGLRAAEAQTDLAGRGAQQLARAGSLVEVSAAGYAPLRATVSASPTGEAHTFWLDRLPTADPALSLAALAAARRPGMALLHGHVLDDATGLPRPGAWVELATSGLSTRTDASGYFALQLPGKGAATPDDLPSTEDLLVRADGFVAERLKNVALFETDVHFIVDLEPGSGEVERDYGHKLVTGTPEPREEPLPLEDEGDGSTLGVSTYALTGQALYLMDPPDSITVRDVGTMSLETYVGNGIVNEWIGSWPASSLMAGAIAYRSYGAAYQASSGSICATSSCQVYKATNSSAGKAAALATSGMMLTASGTAVARSEYSAENNASKCTTYSCSNADLSCGSGKAGSPAAGWPCLDDAHAFSSGPGTCCFGHGRGMCQWGTSAWAKASRNWSWMVNHYYNDEGRGTGKRALTMTSPIEMTAASVSPGSAAPGGSVQVSATLRSYAEGDHSATLLRTSLVLGAAEPLPNPSGAAQVTVLGTAGQANKDTTASQTFAVGAGVAAGTYDLRVEALPRHGWRPRHRVGGPLARDQDRRGGADRHCGAAAGRCWRSRRAGCERRSGCRGAPRCQQRAPRCRWARRWWAGFGRGRLRRGAGAGRRRRGGGDRRLWLLDLGGAG